MTPGFLSGLVAFGLFVLIAIAFGAHRMEMAKIEAIKRAAMHRDRYRDLAFIIDVVPYEPIRGQLPALITRSMAMHLEKCLELDRSNSDLNHLLRSAKELHAKVSQGGAFPVVQHGGSIGEQLKDVQRGIKLLKEFILQQHRGGLLSKAAATTYIKGLHEVNLSATVSGLEGQARHSLLEGNKTLALRYFQLAYGEITKSRSASKYTEQLSELTEEIKRLKADKKTIENATNEINQKLANSLNKKKEDGDGDDDSFEMHQIN